MWHAAAWEPGGNNVVLFGGADANGDALNDCWYLPVRLSAQRNPRDEWLMCTQALASHQEAW